MTGLPQITLIHADECQKRIFSAEDCVSAEKLIVHGYGFEFAEFRHKLKV